jgi:nitronate monooxygenase
VGLFPEMTTTVTAQERIDWVIESGVKILETAGRSPQAYREQIQKGGLTHIHKCARVRDAVKVDGMGVDIVSIVGTECGGHPSMEEVTTLVLIPSALDQIKKPLIAGGGFADGRGLLAALALGASAVNMGTRFMATKECPVHENFKQKMIESIESDTLLVMKSLMNPMRVLKTPAAQKVLELESKGATIEELAPHISGRSSSGWDTGVLDQGMYSTGQVIGRVHDIPSVGELVERIMTQAMEAKKRLDTIFS